MATTRSAKANVGGLCLHSSTANVVWKGQLAENQPRRACLKNKFILDRCIVRNAGYVARGRREIRRLG